MTPFRPAPVVAELEELADVFARHCEREARAAIEARGSFSLAIPGGSVAREFLPKLGSASIDWPHVDILWCDERAVPRGDPDSNFGSARELLGSIRTQARLHPMIVEAELEVAAEIYERELLSVVGPSLVIDLVLLGVGEDGHVASLFPGAPELDRRDRAVLAVHHAPKPPPRRLSLAMHVLAQARTTCLAAFGAEKADAVHDALEASGHPSPAARLVREARSVLILLDLEAGARVT